MFFFKQNMFFFKKTLLQNGTYLIRTIHPGHALSQPYHALHLPDGDAPGIAAAARGIPLPQHFVLLY